MVNKVILIGNVGKDPEVRQAGNSKVANFSLATSENYKDKQGNKQTKTEWHNITIWGNLASVVERFVKKGDKILLEGKVVTRSYEKNGEKRYATDIVCSQMTMLGSGSKTENSQTESENNLDESGDDLPF